MPRPRAPATARWPTTRPADGVRRTAELIDLAIGDDYAQNVTVARRQLDGASGRHDHRAHPPAAGRSRRHRRRAGGVRPCGGRDAGLSCVAPRSRATTSGSASLEFITVGVLLLVPTVYLVLALSALESASFGVEGAARQATRVFVQSESEGERRVRRRAPRSQVTLADYGLDARQRAGRDQLPPESGRLPHPTRLRHRHDHDDRAAAADAAGAADCTCPPASRCSRSATEQVSRFWGSR